MAKNIKKEISKHKDISYSNRDFASIRNELKRFTTTHFNENIVDISDASLGGLLIDLAAYVGDVMSYYIDHQFNETSLETAIEEENVEKLIRATGVKIGGPGPAIVEVAFRIRVPATVISGQYVPNRAYLPKIKKETILTSTTGINFTLMDDINFAEVDEDNNLIATYKVGQLTGNVPINFICELPGICTSSKTKKETFPIGNDLIPFRTLTLGQPDVTEITHVHDSDGDPYYEVESLTQDTVFRRFANSRSDAEYAPQRLHLQHAPKRFVTTRSSITKKTSLRFGAGDDMAFDEDIIPDPSEHAVTLYGDRQTTSKITIDPNSFLETQTLGISPRNTTITVMYRHGGALKHNVAAGSINSVKTLNTLFPTATPTSVATSIRSSLTVRNDTPAAGGEDAPSLEEMRTIAQFGRNSQNRVVTREDLLARVYSMPTNFGRIFRASVRDNPNNPQAAQLHIISRNAKGKLMLSPDTLKENLGLYLSKFRLVSDAIDILDASIINIGINYTVTVDASMNTDTTLNLINAKIGEYFQSKKWQIDQPIVTGEIENLILNTQGVVSLIELNFIGKHGTMNGMNYSETAYDTRRHMDRGYIFPLRGGMFELKFPNEDIVGKVS